MSLSQPHGAFGPQSSTPSGDGHLPLAPVVAHTLDVAATVVPPPALPDQLAGAYPTDVWALLARHASDKVPQQLIFGLAAQLSRIDPRLATAPGPVAQLRRHELSKGDLELLATLPAALVKRLNKQLGADLVSLTPRPVAQVRLQLTGRPAAVYTQRAMHLRTNSEGIGELVHDTTLSSASAYDENLPHNRHVREHLAHAHAVTRDQRLVLFRSGRADTPAKMQQKLAASAAAALEAAGGDPAKATGWHLGADGYRFSSTLLTAMDRSWLKRILMAVARLWGGEISEHRRLRHMTAAYQQLFAKQGGLSVTVRVDGRQQEVKLMPPRIINVVLSGQSGHAHNILQARRANVPALLPMCQQLAAAWAGGDSQAAWVASAYLRRIKGPASARAQLTRLFAAPVYKQLSWTQRQALDLLALHFVGHTMTKKTLRGRADSGAEVMLLKALIDEAEDATLVECKSGIDRTATAVGLMCAADAAGQAPVDATQLGRAFAAVTDALAVGPVFYTRASSKGAGRIKWSSHPTPRAYYPADRHSGGPLGDFGPSQARPSRARLSAPGRAAP